jgi:alkylation response protein AidB-like acyl-CoA dehydrogenase
MVYRTAARLSGIDPEFAVECSAVKVFGSEALDYIVDEALQIFGGYGFTSEYPVERYYRDARVNRIFEGTNEINRLLISRMLFKKNVLSGGVDGAGPLGPARKAMQFVSNLALEKHGEGLKNEQEILLLLADITMEIYAMDSALCRASKTESASGKWIAETFVNDALSRIHWSAVQILSALAEGLELQIHISGLNELSEFKPANTIRNRRHIAEYLLDNASL